MRKAIVEQHGTLYRDKQESLDYIDELLKAELPIHGIEVVKLSRLKAETTMYKTIWFTSQAGVYKRAKDFIKAQMVGVWNYADFK